MTYLYDANYKQLEGKYTARYMEQVNIRFLETQKSAGKEFWFSHDPWFYWKNPQYAPGFQMELEWLSHNYGLNGNLSPYNFVLDSNTGFWKFVPDALI